MSHRIYLYNFSGKDRIQAAEDMRRPGVQHMVDLLASIGSNDEATLLMTEWGYELPFFLYPLLADRPFIAAPLYNGEEGGIYAPAEKGRAFLKTFFNFISKHAVRLTSDPAAFEEARQRIFSYLDEKAVHDFFHLDAWDVFNISDEPHAEQAEELLDAITSANGIIERAIATDDPSLLDKYPELRSSGFKSFRDFFSFSGYDYGWAILHSGYFEEDEDESDQVIFKENGRMGLKDREGNVLVPAKYDDVYTFPEGEEYTLVYNNTKYAYVNRSGEEVTGFIYDDAFDVVKGRAVVRTGKKYNLLRFTGEGQPAANTYDGLFLLDEEQLYFGAQQNGNWGIIDGDDRLRVPFEYGEEIELVPIGGFTFYKLKYAGKKRLHFYTQELNRFGGDDIVQLEWAATLPDGPVIRFTVAPEGQHKKKLERHGLADRHGKVILPAVYKEIKPAHTPAVIVREDARYGMYDADKGWLLACEYDRIASMSNDVYLLTREGKRRLFLVGHGWISPAYDLICTGFHWRDDSWELPAFTGDEVFIITGEATVTQLDHAGIVERLDSRYRNAYDSHVLERLVGLAGDELPADILFDKGAEAFADGDYPSAIRYYELSAAKGMADAMNDLGFLYESVPAYRDEQKAFAWYKKGAENDSAFAMNGLGACYENGTGVKQDMVKAFHWYQQAAQRHQPNAHFNLGRLYVLGTAVPQDLDRSLEHLLKAEEVNAAVYEYLGYVYQQKGEFEDAINSYKKGIRADNSYCAYKIAWLYENGYGCKADSRKALSYLIKAVELGGMPAAHLELRRMYLYDDTVRDPEKAKEHEALAKEAGLEI